MILIITELSYLVKGNTFAVESHTVLLGTLTSASSASSPASAEDPWPWMTEEMTEQLEGSTSTLSQFQSTSWGKIESANYVECDFLSGSLIPWGKEDPPHSAGSALSVLPKMLLPFVLRACCWLTTTLSTRTPRYFLQSHPSAWAGAWGWFSSGTGLALQFVELRMVHTCFFNPLRSSKSNGVSTTLTLGTSVNVLRVQFSAVIQVSHEEVGQHWPQQSLLRCITVDWPPAGLHACWSQLCETDGSADVQYTSLYTYLVCTSSPSLWDCCGR